MIQNLFFFFFFFFLKILYRAHNFYTFVHVFQWTSVSLKKPHSFYEPQLTWHWKWYALATQAKTFPTLEIFQQTCFCLVLEKTFALHHFWTPNNCILEALWKQISVYFCVSLSKNVCSRDVARFYLMESGLMGEGGEPE